jgi:ribokinase
LNGSFSRRIPIGAAQSTKKHFDIVSSERHNYFEPIQKNFHRGRPERQTEDEMEHRRRIVVVGSANMDMVIPLDRLPLLGETIAGGDMALFPGGKGANQACAAGKLGGLVSFIGQVGSDPFGAALVASLNTAGVETSDVGVSGGTTGCASIYVLPGGENSIVISPGANATLDPDAALSRLEKLDAVGYVLLQLEIPMETVEAVAEWARAHGSITILDPAPARPLSPALLRNIDFLTPNQSEAAALLGEPRGEIRDFAEAEEAAAGLLALGPAAIVMKLGAMGCLLATRGMLKRIEGLPVAAIDTTAAGDAFNGAFAIALAEGKEPVDAAEFANAVAALSVGKIGAQASLPWREEVSRFLDPSVAVGTGA